MAKDESFQVDANLAGLLIGCDQIKETVKIFRADYAIRMDYCVKTSASCAIFFRLIIFEACFTRF